MRWDDEILMAFADNELEPSDGAALQAALELDPLLQQRLGTLLNQRQRLVGAFDTVLAEAIPDRLTQLLQVAAAPQLTALPTAARAPAPLQQRLAGWLRQIWIPSDAGTWGALAASVVVGVLIGANWPAAERDTGLAMGGGRLLADGRIALALTAQLASENGAEKPVSVQLSFVDLSGQYCRTFSTPDLAGLACLKGARWEVQTLCAPEGSGAGEVRQAATAIPRAVLDAVDARIKGSPLDADGEKAARTRNWH